MLTLGYRLALVLTTSLATLACFAANDQPVVPHVTVTGCTVDSAYVRALAETVATARDVYSEWGFNMPESVNLSVTCKEGASPSLFTDGNDQLFLTIPSQDALAPPAKSGVTNIYGMCHELGHVAMYRILKDRDWLANDAAEGWAHYIGSVVVDSVFAAKGESLWPEPYDYRQEGTARLQKDIASKSPSDLAMAAAQWQKLGAIIGPRGFAPLFAAWQSADIDPVKPSETLLPVLRKLQPQSESALTRWWQGAAPVVLEKLQLSEFRAEQASPTGLSGKTVTLPPNIGAETSHMSGSGVGEGRKFAVAGPGEWYITAVWVYGSRYGAENPPETTFDIALSDGDARLISIWKGRYASFTYGQQDAWARFDVPPTRVPSAFYITLNFRATYTNGVYVAFDSTSRGNSVDSLPGKSLHEFAGGDWMIRTELVRGK